MIKFLGLVLMMSLSSYQVTAQSEKDALLLNPNKTVEQELIFAISKMLGTPKILLSAKDFTQSSILPVERIRLKDADGLRMQGLEMEEPHYFKLIKKNEECFLILLKTNKRLHIKSAKCE
jgi:hypothetical protein